MALPRSSSADPFLPPPPPAHAAAASPRLHAGAKGDRHTEGSASSGTAEGDVLPVAKLMRMGSEDESEAAAGDTVPAAAAAAAAAWEESEDMTKVVSVGILGDGKVGRALARTIGSAGFSILVGSRKPGLPTFNDAAGFGQVVFLCVPGNYVVEVVEANKANLLQAKAVVDVSNPCSWGNNGPLYVPPPEGSLAQAILRTAPELQLVKGFNDLACEQHANPMHTGSKATTAVCGNDAKAKKLVQKLGRSCGFEVVDGGRLEKAAVSEKFAIDEWRKFRLLKIERMLALCRQDQTGQASESDSHAGEDVPLARISSLISTASTNQESFSAVASDSRENSLLFGSFKTI